MSSPANAQAGPYRKLALVIGNAEYDGNVLDNPERDASAISGRLKALGFTVTQAVNQGRQQLGSTIAQFEDQVGDNDFVLIFYAGHGIEAAGQTYLIPVDAKLMSPSAPKLEGLKVEDLWSFNHRPFGVVILFDACRNSPFLERVSGDVAGAHAVSTPDNTLLLFSSSAGHPATDGAGAGHSAFTSALLDALSRPDTRLDEVVRVIKSGVRVATNERQIPQRYGGLNQEFSFSGVAPLQYGAQFAPPPPAAPSVAATAPTAAAPMQLADAGPKAARAEEDAPPGTLRSAKAASSHAAPPLPIVATAAPPPPIVATAAPAPIVVAMAAPPSRIVAAAAPSPEPSPANPDAARVARPVLRGLQQEKIEEIVVPKSFCSLEAKYDFVNSKHKPANEAAMRNNEAARNYKAELGALYMKYRDATRSALYSADIRAELERVTPLADQAFVTAQTVMHLFEAIMAVPVSSDCKR